MIIVSKEEGAKWPTLGSKGELRGFYGTVQRIVVEKSSFFVFF